MGRLVTFLARMMQKTDKGPQVLPGKALAWALGVDEATAVLLELKGLTTVTGKESAYFLTAPVKPRYFVAKPGKFLFYGAVNVYRLGVGGGQTFNLKKWTGNGGASYQVTAMFGLLFSNWGGPLFYY